MQWSVFRGFVRVRWAAKTAFTDIVHVAYHLALATAEHEVEAVAGTADARVGVLLLEQSELMAERLHFLLDDFLLPLRGGRREKFFASGG